MENKILYSLLIRQVEFLEADLLKYSNIVLNKFVAQALLEQIYLDGCDRVNFFIKTTVLVFRQTAWNGGWI